MEVRIGADKLPGAENASVPLRKITEYLLSESHPAGQPKARFFIGLAFDPDEPDLLQAALVQVASEGTVTASFVTPHGSKYVVDGYVTGPKGRLASVRTVWVIEPGADGPRLITAYPGRKREG